MSAQRSYYEKNRTRILLKACMKRMMNPTKKRAEETKWRHANRDKVSVINKRYRETHAEELKRYRDENKDEINRKRRERYSQNKDEINRKRREKKKNATNK